MQFTNNSTFTPSTLCPTLPLLCYGKIYPCYGGMVMGRGLMVKGNIFNMVVVGNVKNSTDFYKCKAIMKCWKLCCFKLCSWLFIENFVVIIIARVIIMQREKSVGVLTVWLFCLWPWPGILYFVFGNFLNLLCPHCFVSSSRLHVVTGSHYINFLLDNRLRAIFFLI